VRSTRNQKLLAVSIIVLALLLLTPLAEVAVGAALLGVVALLMIRFYPRARDHDRG
jgi:4-hydroxybenzoate polyprenyltransferase